MDDQQGAVVMVLDDNPKNIKVVAIILEDQGYQPAVFMHAKRALEFLEDNKPELILLDIMMPEIDGYEVCKKLKSEPTTADIPVIFLTAKTDIDDLVKGFDCGAVDYVTKPFKARELLARVHTHIELKRARERIKTLDGLLPICAHCKNIRDDKGYWNQVEEYIRNHSRANFSHSICPDCMEKLYCNEKWYKNMKAKKEQESKTQ